MAKTYEEILAYNRAHYAANREKISEQRRQARKADPEKQREIHKRRLPYLAQWRKNNPDKCREYWKRRNKRRYGLTLEQWDEMFASQDRRCANPGCRRSDPGTALGWHTDHCHTTGKVRGILCGGCNSALGHANDRREALRGLADYLERHAQCDSDETHGA